MIKVGIIQSAEDLNKLSKIIGKERYVRLIDCCNFAHKNTEIQHYLTNISNDKRKRLQAKSEKSNKPTIVDLFCGAGGLSLGFIEAGYRVVLANDIQDVCCETYRYNHPELPSEKVIQGDIQKLLKGFSISEAVDLVVGGPHVKALVQPINIIRL